MRNSLRILVSREFLQQGNGSVFIHMKVPFTRRLKTNDRPVLAVVCAMRSDDAYFIIEPEILHIPFEGLAGVFAAALFTLLACADVKDFMRRMFFFAHE